MNSTIKKTVKKICGGNASCEKFVSGFLDNGRPKIQVGYKCSCKKRRV